MQELLDDLSKSYDLSLGNKSFSPIMKLSIGLAMKYHEEVKNGFDKPFHLNFPDKLDAALWLSLALMRNYLKKDFENQPLNRIETLNLKKGNKIEIYGAIARVESAFRDQIKISFLDQSGIFVNDSDYDHVNIIDSGRKENRHDIYRRNKANIKKNRNAISKLLEPNKSTIVNQKILKSKTLVVAGRGNTGNFTNRSKVEAIFNENLFDVFGGGQNLIIKPDLEDLTFLAKKVDSNIEDRFKDRFLRFIHELIEELPDRKNDIDNLLKNVNENNFRTKEFKTLFDEIVDECDQESKYQKIKDSYPGIKEELPKNLKSVVINDITQLETYRGVIEKLLNRGIPVIVISNRYIEDKKALSFFDNYFKTHTEDLRISWDKKKIRKISDPSLKVESSLDYGLWKKCLKFSKQVIKIETTEAHPVDDLLMDLQRAISNLEGHERLRNAYWRYFNPLVYSFKNSSAFESYHEDLLAEFLSVYEEVKDTLTQEMKSIIDNFIYELKANKQTFKKFNKDKYLFGQHLDFEDRTVLFPRGDYKYITNENINGSPSHITFPGFPLNEPLNNYLLDSINESMIQDINIVCWPKEGMLTYNYILNRLKAGYYTDNTPEHWGFPAELLLKDGKIIEKEIHETLSLDLNTQKAIEESNYETEEDVLRKISEFKYSAYQSIRSSDSNEKVSCNIIDLQGNRFIFLPKTSSVMAKIETESDRYEIRKVKFDDLSLGDEIFQYELTRHRLRELSKVVDYGENIFAKLELWRESLKKSLVEEGGDLKSLLQRLKNVNSEKRLNANPTYQNLRNWLFDEDMLSPEIQNLKMILFADSDTEMINEFTNIYDAYKKARSISRTVSSKIKKLIIKKLKSMILDEKTDFEIQIFGSPMEIEFRKIKNLQKADIEVDYQHTRKMVE